MNVVTIKYCSSFGMSEMLHKYDRIKSYYRALSENQLHIWVVKTAKYVFLSFYPPAHSRIANLLAFYDLKERLGSCRESNSDKYILLKLHCLISHQSNLKFNLMFDREPAYSLQDTLTCWGHLVREKFGLYHFAKVGASAVFLRKII